MKTVLFPAEIKKSTIQREFVNNVFKNATVLVTGHTGFKGSWLSIWLNQLGANVHGLSLDVPTSPSHYEAASLSSEINDYRLDVRNENALSTLINDIKPDFIFHLAAQPLVRKAYADPIATWTTNTIGTVNILEALRKMNKACVALMITSDKAYDNVEWVWGYRENDRLGGSDPYSASKAGAELAIKSFVDSYFNENSLVRVGIGRAGNVIGGGDWAQDRVVPDCMRAWGNSEIVELRNPLATRPWQHVLEPLGGYLELASALHKSNKLHGEAFNFGPIDQKNYSVMDLVVQMSRTWDAVQWKDVSGGANGPHESGLLKLNCDKALHYLNWQAVWNFGTTVDKTVEWYKNYYSSPNQSSLSCTLTQIADYSKSAAEQGFKWAI